MPSTPRRASVAIACLLFLACPVEPSFGYRIYHTPIHDQPYKWCEAEIPYRVAVGDGDDLSAEVLAETVRAAFDTWGAVEDCAIPTPQRVGSSDKGIGEFTPCVEGNDNLVVFVTDRDAWAGRQFSSTALAFTTLTFIDQTGKIVDADIQLNDWNFTFSDQGCVAAPHDHDLLNTLVHEVGHFYGLDHSQDVNATMWARASSGECAMRTLSQDDIDGVCAIYTVPCAERQPVVCPGDADAASGDGAGGDATNSADVTVPDAGRRRPQGCGGAAPASILWLAAALAATARRRQTTPRSFSTSSGTALKASATRP